MKEGLIVKSSGGEGVSAEQLELIGAYCRKKPEAQDVYIFSMVLCDNAIDRDYECFTPQALEALAKLFPGKTGIFDHNPKGENQTARIFTAWTEADEQKTGAFGTPYHCLKASAYMIRCDKNKDLILEIDGGIKKEVSVGCAVAKRSCSICGADLVQGSCSHRPGKSYTVDGQKQLCAVWLDDVKDAYEWSFVAVPAQRAAGITKKMQGVQEAAGKPCHQPPKEAAHLEKQAALGRRYLQELTARAAKMIRLAAPEVTGEALAALEKALGALDAEELEAVEKAFAREAGRHLPLVPQLLPTDGGYNRPAGKSTPMEREANYAFKI